MTDRRSFVRLLASGASSSVFGRALLAASSGAAKATPEMVAQAEWVAGVEFTEEERKLLLEDLNELLGKFRAVRAVPLDNGVAPAIRFTPLESPAPPEAALKPEPLDKMPGRGSDEDLAFASVRKLASLLAARKVSARELAEVSLARIAAHDPKLSAVITVTADLARRQALTADEERARHKLRGPLHGLPWAAKDLIAVPGHPTTWGSPIYRERVRPEKATCVARVEEAGGVLVAKTAVGELAWGDVWFGGKCKNPWKLDQGSSGSSAGSSAAVAAGLVPFALGTETWGSVLSPATRCGVTGLRPTFGRVSRHGVMALSWSMDKVGVLTRSARDAAAVFAAIHGADPLDPSAVSRPFAWPQKRAVASLRVGVLRSLFEEDRAAKVTKEEDRPAAREAQEIDAKALAVVEKLGAKLVPFEPPANVDVQALSFILRAEAATAFDDLVRTGRVKEMVRQTADAWPNVFRLGQLVPAVEYIRANRVRTLLMQAMEERMRDVDVLVAPTFGGDMLLLTNLTGHPQVCVPNGFRANGTPTSLTFTGRLFGEAAMLSLAAAFQDATDFHTRRPPGF